MKTRMIIICFVMLNLFQQSNLKAQHYVTIPDTAFARYLRNTYPSCMNGNQMDTTCTAITSATTFSNILFYQFVDLTGIQYFNHLLTLDCSNINTITTIPKLPPLLTSLNVMDNQLTVLPALPNSLTYLECEQNQLTSLPVLPSNLQTLFCDGNLITSLPALPTSLQNLNCSMDSLTSLPVLPSSLTQLSCQQNKLTTLPALPSGLQYLDCVGNKITSIPALPSSLLQLMFGSNHVSIIPSLPSSLNLLDCSVNHISSLPTLPNTLTRLFCSNNQIVNLPALPSSIYELYCDNNLLTSLPTLPSALQNFYCNNNQISVLPALPLSLTYLECSYNQLTSIPSLPTSLTDLTCDYNQLTYLPILPAALQNLSCNNNLLTYLPALPVSLYTLYIENNNISCFPPFPVQLSDISINGNSFTCLPNYNQYMDASLLAYPLCVSGDVIHNPNGCANSKGITGNTYKDNNANCTYDVTDTGINHFSLKTFDNTGTLLAQSYSYYDGRYFFQDSIGTFTIALDTAGMPFTVLCPHPGVDSTLILSTANPLAKNINFAIACKPGFDIGVQSIVSDGIIFPGESNNWSFNVGDLSSLYGLHCASGISGQVVISVSGPVTFNSVSSGSLIPYISGNVFTYNVADFGTINIYSAFQLLFTTDTAAVIGDSICVSISVTPTNGDNNIGNNNYHFCFIVGNSYDPNEKETYPVNVQPRFNDYFTYTVQFQNTGTAAAHNISVTDTLSSLLDLSTFQLLNYSNANITSVLGNTLIVRFPNINLVDSTVSADSSIGYFQYRIKPKANLPAGTQIFNKANIYFDYNAPVVTNTTVNNYVLTTGINKVQNTSLSIYPNPSNGKYFVNISDAKDVSKLTIEVTNLLGESIYKSLILNPKSELDLSNQANGVYFVRIIGGEQSLNKKIVKQ